MSVKEAAAPAVELRGLTKVYNGVAANQGIQLAVREGSIHAIIGENGAGKSTAMKMLYGMVRPDGGEILIRGQARAWATPADAIAAGIGMVHQHFMLADPYSALENIVLGAEGLSERAGKGWLPNFLRPLRRARVRARLDELSSRYGFQALDWDAPIERFPVGVQQRIEILKLLYRNASILILDEPTAVLTPQETIELFANLKRMAREGKTILIITHKLKEVMSLADEVTVFRGGRVVGHRRIEETSMEDLASLMVGRKVSLQVEAPPLPVLGEPVLEVEGLELASTAAQPLHPLRGVSLRIRAGEVVGIAGVEGNGQSELLRALLQPAGFPVQALAGRVRVLGRPSVEGRLRLSTRDIKDLGVGVIPEDRHRQGLLLERPLYENFLLGLQGREPFSRRGVLSFAELRRATERGMEAYDVRPRNADLNSGALSGGNQQKLIIAREFERKPRFLVAAQPTRGVDVGAIEFIHRRILEARTAGAGVLLVSSELDEILALSDRILVMYEGRIAAEFARGAADERTLGLYMGGATSATAAMPATTATTTT